MNHLGVENIHLFNWASFYPSTLQSAHKGFGFVWVCLESHCLQWLHVTLRRIHVTGGEDISVKASYFPLRSATNILNVTTQVFASVHTIFDC